MPLHAIDDIGAAIDATKSFLLPFSVQTWVKLAIVVFFIGGGGTGLNNTQSLNGAGGPQGQPGGVTGFDDPLFAGMELTVDSVASALSPEILVIIGVVLLLALLFSALGSFMEFVFVQSLVSRAVHVRRYFRENTGNGLRLLVFRLAVNLSVLLVTGLFLYGLFVTVFDGSIANITAMALLRALPLFIAFFLPLALVQGLLTGFTNAFVVPMMLTGDRGVLASWRRLLASLRANPKQYLVYLLFSVVLGIGVGIVSAVLGVIFLLLAGIPFVLAAALFWFALGGGAASLALIAVTLLLFVPVMLLVTNLIKVPLQTFLRYYAMLVLGDIDEPLDPIPVVRADVRPAEPDGDGPASGAT